MLKGAGCDPEIVFWNRSAFLLKRGLESPITVRSGEILWHYRTSLDQAIDTDTISLRLTGLLNSKEKLADNCQGEKHLQPRAAPRFKIYFPIENPNRNVRVEQVPTTH